MTIYSNNPTDWRDLQNKVANLLTQVGYETEVEKDIHTVRETINVDICAVNNRDEPKSKILCECKHWNNPVPKTIVHAFRTTVVDFGANYGIIISKAGFQKGAYEAIKNTNILLFNWGEFQEYFRNSWIAHRQFAISKETKALLDYVSAVALVYFRNEINCLTQDERNAFNYLCEKHFNAAFYSMNQDFKNSNTNKFDFDTFKGMFERAVKEFQKNFYSYEEYYSFLLEKANEGVADFDQLFKKALRYVN